MADRKLTDRQVRFCHEYLVDLNATRAAEAAGYSKVSASQQGSELLGKPEVRALVDELLAAKNSVSKVTRERILEELEKIAFSDFVDLVELNTSGLSFKDLKGMGKARRAIQEISDSPKQGAKLKLYDKLDALKTLYKYMGFEEQNDGKRDRRSSAQRISEALRKLKGK